MIGINTALLERETSYCPKFLFWVRTQPQYLGVSGQCTRVKIGGSGTHSTWNSTSTWKYMKYLEFGTL